MGRKILLDQLTGQARSRAELAAKLARKRVPPEVAATLLDRFEEVGLVDDAAFARDWVESRQASRGLARRALSVELRRKGVDSDVIAEAVDEVSADDEDAAARELVRRKLRSLSRYDDATVVRRLTGMLARKGYPSSVASGWCVRRSRRPTSCSTPTSDDRGARLRGRSAGANAPCPASKRAPSLGGSCLPPPPRRPPPHRCCCRPRSSGCWAGPSSWCCWPAWAVLRRSPASWPRAARPSCTATCTSSGSTSSGASSGSPSGRRGEDEERRRLEEQAAEVADAAADRAALLERVARLSVDEARAEVLAPPSTRPGSAPPPWPATSRPRRAADAEAEAKRVLSTAIQRLASEQSADLTVSVVHLASDDLKGRIIGREGRNIRAFEQITGRQPGHRRHPGGGRAQLLRPGPPRGRPARPRGAARPTAGSTPPGSRRSTSAAVEQVERLCRTAGEDACLEMGITDLHPELVLTMGRLRYRSSYGQNVLAHLVESGHAAGLLADELGVDRAVCVRGAFLHDIGKALTHEVEGSHALVGADLARRHGEHEDVVHAIEAHHNEVEPRTVEGWLTQAADAISGGRPGARRESLESYVKRLERLEEIALAQPGVEKVYAMQAGRDLRVMVLPDAVDDLQAQVLARDIAKQIEEELTYPGQIKVTVIRESRATEVAR